MRFAEADAAFPLTGSSDDPPRTHRIRFLAITALPTRKPTPVPKRRSIYVLDDYSPLRVATPETMQKESALFPVKTALSYLPQNRGGDLGTNYFTAPNPPVGAAITYNLKDGYTGKRAERQKRERAAIERGETPAYPTPEALHAEAEEEPPAILVTIADASGKAVRRLEEPATRGVHRFTWDLRAQPVTLAPAIPAGGGRGGRSGAGGGGVPSGSGGGDEETMTVFGGRGGGAGALVAPGRYTVTLARRVEGVVTPLPGSQTFDVTGEGPSTNADRQALADFQEKLARLQKALTATQQTAADAGTRLTAIRRAIDATPALPFKLHEETLKLERSLGEIDLALSGDRIIRAHNEGSPASISEHVQAAQSPTRGTTGRPTRTAMEQYQIASDGLAAEIPKLRRLLETDIKALEKQLDAAGAPPTPGRLPDWKPGR